MAATAPPLFEALRWTEPGAEHAVLSGQPAVCLAYRSGDKPIVQAGHALFNTPTLLGGQAAKAGLACASCHVNGRDNPHFVIAGVSDKPGTADVTNSFFSGAHGNGRFDPVLIPDLAVPGKISHAPADKALEPFIRGLIVDEFSGREPTPAMLGALAAYVRAIQSCAGTGKALTPRKLEDQLSIIRAAVDGSAAMAERGDPQAVRMLIAAARHQLGLISERYAGPRLKRERALLLEASRALQLLDGKQQNPRQFASDIYGWTAHFETKVAAPLMATEDKSLYNPKLLATALAASHKFR